MFYIPHFLCIPLLARATSKSLQFYIYAYVDLVAGICRLLLFSNIVLVMVYSFMIRTRTNKCMSWNRFSCTLGYSKGLKWSLTKQLRALSFVSSFYYFVDVSPSPCELIWWWETFLVIFEIYTIEAALHRWTKRQKLQWGEMIPLHKKNG